MCAHASACLCLCVFSSTVPQTTEADPPLQRSAKQPGRQVSLSSLWGIIREVFIFFWALASEIALLPLRVSASTQKLRVHLLPSLLLLAFNYFCTELLISHRHTACQLGSRDCCPIVMITSLHFPIQRGVSKIQSISLMVYFNPNFYCYHSKHSYTARTGRG